jgi:CubicO group peptidase (beta-lactamase class C family)
MSTNDGTHHGTNAAAIASSPIAPDPAVVAYLRDAPPPREAIEEADVTNAINQLELAASFATTTDAGTRWVPGLSIVVVRREGKPRYFAYGTKHIDKDAPIGADTLFPCASLSKPVSASIIAAGALGESDWNWDVPVEKPGIKKDYQLEHSPAGKPPTLRQWLSHLSGMPDHAGDLIEDMNPEMGRHDLIENILAEQTGIVPGKFKYTNMGFTIGCFGAMKALGGSEWDGFALERLKKLGMTQSTYSFLSVYKDSSNRAFPHQGQPLPPELQSLAPKGWTWHVTSEADERNPRRQAPAGSLLSSATDLGKFLTRHLNEEFGKDYPSRNPKPEEGAYSLGWNVANHGFAANMRNSVSFNHSGAFRQGAGTFLRFDPDMHIGIAILSNGEPTGVPEALGQLFFKTLYRQNLPPGCDYATLFATMRSAYLGMMYAQKIKNYESYHARPRVPIPDRIREGEVFRGHSNYFGCDITIERKEPTSPGDSGLYLTMGKGKDGHPFWRFQLECIDAYTLTFVYETKGENEVGPSAIRLIWQDNAVIQIVDDWLNEQGEKLGVIDRSH